MKAITSKQAHQIAKKIGIEIDDDGITFYATNQEETEIWSFDSKKERDVFINK